MKSVPERFVKDCITLAYKKTSSGESLASVISSLIYDVYAMGTTVGAAAEREACIKLIEDFSKTTMVPVRDTWVMGLIAGANALRARGQK